MRDRVRRLAVPNLLVGLLLLFLVLMGWGDVVWAGVVVLGVLDLLVLVGGLGLPWRSSPVPPADAPDREE